MCKLHVSSFVLFSQSVFFRRDSTCSDSVMESIESIDVAMNFAETSAGSAESLESISGKRGDHGKQH